MRSDLKAKADHLARLIKKHGGWIDGEHVRFPTPHALTQFEAALNSEKDK